MVNIEEKGGDRLYRVYLVDDDVYLRKGLKKHFEWEKYGATIIGEAENGKKGMV